MEEVKDEEKYTQGFNSGYFLQSTRPSLLQTLLDGIHEGSTDYTKGMMAGRNEFVREQKMQAIRHHYEKDKDKGKDDRGR